MLLVEHGSQTLYSKSRMQLQTILCVAFNNLSVTDSIWIRADDAYLFVGGIYTL